MAPAWDRWRYAAPAAADVLVVPFDGPFDGLPDVEPEEPLEEVSEPVLDPVLEPVLDPGELFLASVRLSVR